MLGEEQECLPSAFRKDQGIPFVRQCEFNELSGDSRIVGYQDLRLLSDNSHLVVTKRSRLPLALVAAITTSEIICPLPPLQSLDASNTDSPVTVHPPECG